MSRVRIPGTLIGLLLGMGIGATLGVLFAPSSGEETRDYLIGTAKDAMNEVVSRGQTLTRRAKGAVDEIAGGVNDAGDAVQRAYSKAKGA